MKIIFIVNVLLALLISFSVQAESSQNNPPTRIEKLSVEGMTTPLCPVLFKELMMKQKGVNWVKASLDDNTAEINYESGQVDISTLQQLLKDELGFSTTVRH